MAKSAFFTPVKSRSRGQSLSEFMILLSVMVLYIMVFSMIYGGQQTNQFYFLEALLGKTAGESVAMASNAAYIAGNGSQTSISVPSIEGDFSIISHSVLVTLEDRVISSPMITSSVSGNLSAGPKTARNSYGNITIE
ncbi:MAG: hypothetical protein WC408_03955 [Candidatus Micrarchaeia archaeon]|jgi:uncharacterized protein (UPF0333 family)